MKIDWKGIWEATKEPLRYVVLAIIPFFITYLLSINQEWAILVTLILRGIDSYLSKPATAFLQDPSNRPNQSSEIDNHN